MKHLSSLDATFLYFESPETPMHVGSLLLVDTAEGYGGDFYEDVKEHLAHRMHLAPVFERKLATMPLDLADPVWVDDEADLDYHVRRIALPRPGTIAQLEAYVGRLHSNLLDRSRPLWEIYVIEGLETGQHAIYTKFHHAGMDGAAGMAVAAAMLDVTPEPREVEPPRARRRRSQPGAAELASAAVSNLAARYVKLVKLVPDAAKAVARVALPAKGESGVSLAQLPSLPGLPVGWEFAPRTPFNVAITGQRAFAAQTLPLAAAKAAAKGLGVTINDVVMTLCGTALRDYLKGRGGVPDKSLVAVVPVSLRGEGDTRQNNQVTLTLASLATDVADPAARLGAVHKSCASMKRATGSFKAALPLDLPVFGAPWLLTGLATLYGRLRLAEAIPPMANVVVSNVPGPQFPLYFAGARLTTYFPVSIPYHGVALNITVQSYDGSLDFGLTACRRAVPDVRRLADLLPAALEQLTSLVTPPEPPEPRAARKRATKARARAASKTEKA